MFERVKKTLRKPVKLFTLMAGLAVSPVAHGIQADLEEALRLIEEMQSEEGNAFDDRKSTAASDDSKEAAPDFIGQDYTECSLHQTEAAQELDQLREEEKSELTDSSSDFIKNAEPIENVQPESEMKSDQTPVVSEPSNDDKKVLTDEKNDKPSDAKNFGQKLDILMGLGIFGSLIMGALVAHQMNKRKQNENKSSNVADKSDLSVSNNSAVLDKPQSSQKTLRPKVVLAPTPQSVKSEQMPEMNDINIRLKGIRLLGNIKNKRAELTRRKKVLIAERENATIERQAEINVLLDEISVQRRDLSLQKRQADIWAKGKTGEKIKEQRRLYTKNMTQLRRLMKKDGLAHTDEINEINAARLNLKNQEKELMRKAREEVSERTEKSNWVHGIRALNEAKIKQRILDQRIEMLKKELGARKKEILDANRALWQEQHQIDLAKREALRLIRGRSFASQKNVLNRQLKVALAEYNTVVADEISRQYQSVKQAEKACLQNAKDLDYDTQRINLINGLTAQRIYQRRKKQKIKRERLKKARFLRGQRMLYHLKNGWSSSVNTNQMTAEDYRQEALKLVGDKRQKFDYPKARCHYLKDKILAGIYRRQKENNRG